MFALARLVLILLVVLTIAYVSLSLYSRSVRRDKLEAEWDDLHSDGSPPDDDEDSLFARLTRRWDEEGRSGDRETFIREGLEDYDQSLRRKLILGVYVVPILLIGTIIYFVNSN